MDFCLPRDVVIIILILVALCFLYKLNKEGFTNLTENYVYGNPFGIADNLEYGQSEAKPLFGPDYPTATAPPSVNFGVNQAGPRNIFDDRGFKWTRNAKDANVDVVMSRMSDDALRQSFANMYMLDPSGVVSQNDIANMPVSEGCCPNQFGVPFDTGIDSCALAQKYVANNYSADSTFSQNGVGCPCITPKNAEYYANRGGNTGGASM